MKLTVKKVEKEWEVYDPRKHGVSVSALQTFLRCRELARQRYLCGWRADYTKQAFFLGDINATLQDEYYSEMRNGNVSTPQAGAVIVEDKAFQIAEKVYASGDLQQAEMLDDNLPGIIAVAKAYVAHHWKEDSEVEWTHVEDEFLVDFGGLAPFKGKYDGGLIKKGRQWVFETKFKAQWGETFIDALLMDLQVSGYVFSMMEDGKEPAGCIYNLVRKPKPKGKRATVTEYVGKIKDDIAARPSFYFQRIDIPFSKQEKQRACDRMRHLIDQFVLWYEQAQLTTPDLGLNAWECVGKYGSCEFLQACTEGDHTAYTTKHPELQRRANATKKAKNGHKGKEGKKGSGSKTQGTKTKFKLAN